MISSDRFAMRMYRASKSRGLRKLDSKSSLMIFADVAIETTTRELAERLFTYHVPEHLYDEVFVGSQVLVPFGHQEQVAGYVVSVRDSVIEPRPNDAHIKTKPVLEVLESEPLFDKNYISFLYWVADYYAASIRDVIAAAIPSDVGGKAKRVVRLISDTSNDGTLTHRIPQTEEQQHVIALIKEAKNGAVSLKTLKQRSGLSMSRFYGVLSKLRQLELVTVEREAEAGVAVKYVDTVIATGETSGTKKQLDILAALKRAGGQLPVSELAQTAATTSATIKRMCAGGLLRLIKEEIIRDPLESVLKKHPVPVVPPLLTDQQAKVLDTLSEALREATVRTEPLQATKIPWLLHGVTGSGKTEIYLRLIDQTLQTDRTALMLVPEISLTPQLAHRLVERFGNQVAVWHSGLSPGERFDTWRRLKNGQARVLLGARSAVLANLPNLGLIILDEEHDSSYKQSSPSPRYNAKTLASERARRTGALVLLGSATPDVGTFLECRENNKIVELPERVFKQALPESILIDMRHEFLLGNKNVLSSHLQEALAERLRRGEQSILLINRRGYASHVFCRACGHVMRCRNCSVSLVFHQTSGDSDGYLICHHCAFTAQASDSCPACRSPFIKAFGLGTQRIEEEVRALFPSARILRLDSDVTTRKGAYEEIFHSFASGDADILIGTQIVAKGLDVAKVTLVGVLAADAAFNLPDYRSMERGFQLLTQVSGRAGRGKHPGQVILQTYNLDLPALDLARRQDYATFVEQELTARKTFEYPPFSQIIRVVIAGDTTEHVNGACEQLAEELSIFLEDKFTEEQVKILGPAPCVIERLRGKYRFQLMIKNLAGEPGRRAVAGFLKLRQGQDGLTIAVDIDALDLV